MIQPEGSGPWLCPAGSQQLSGSSASLHGTCPCKMEAFQSKPAVFDKGPTTSSPLIRATVAAQTIFNTSNQPSLPVHNWQCGHHCSQIKLPPSSTKGSGRTQCFEGQSVELNHCHPSFWQAPVHPKFKRISQHHASQLYRSKLLDIYWILQLAKRLQPTPKNGAQSSIIKHQMSCAG